MNRQKRGQNKRDRQNTFTKKARKETMTIGERAFTIAVSLAIIFFFLYIALRDNSLPQNELSTINVTLKDAPKYDEYTIKSTTYRDIVLTTKEYKCDFKIKAMTYKATDHIAFKANILAGDKVELKVKKTELDHLNETTFWKKHNDVYGLIKNGNDYVDINLRTELIDKDSKMYYFFVILGLVMLPYGFLKSKPLISMDKAISIASVIGLIIMLILSRQ